MNLDALTALGTAQAKQETTSEWAPLLTQKTDARVSDQRK